MGPQIRTHERAHSWSCICVTAAWGSTVCPRPSAQPRSCPRLPWPTWPCTAPQSSSVPLTARRTQASAKNGSSSATTLASPTPAEKRSMLSACAVSCRKPRKTPQEPQLPADCGPSPPWTIVPVRQARTATQGAQAQPFLPGIVDLARRAADPQRTDLQQRRSVSTGSIPPAHARATRALRLRGSG